ncbi:MAG: hypothetical protein HC786_30060 [Richelia sp. CSU_2_1]|nr:hypothetical protein [Microcoleus sp. SU_5_6]NJR26049.1 hypothetical protein [Richelia sp. CSU_2_1]
MTFVDDSETIALKPFWESFRILEQKEKMAVVGAIFCTLDRAKTGELTPQFLGDKETWSEDLVSCVETMKGLKRKQLRVLLSELPWN